ncbi:LysR substrate-binding domain-containing protein [Aquimonas voraii]
MHDLNDLQYFALVVEHGGFSKAERASGMPKSRLSRRITALEDSLGARLLQRSTRRFAVTDLGQSVYRHARAMLDEAQAAREVVERQSAVPRGLVRLSAPVAIAQRQLALLLPEFLERYPEVRVQLHVSNRRVDLINEGIDVALRVRTRLNDDGSLILRSFAQINEFLVASPRYLDRSGRPRHPVDLAAHACLSMSEEPGQQRWELHGPEGAIERVDFQPRLMAHDFPVLREVAAAGHGIALLPETVCADLLGNGALERVLPDWSLPQGIFHAVFPSRSGLLPSIRALIDFLAERLPQLIDDQRRHSGSARADDVEAAGSASVPARSRLRGRAAR